MSSSLCSSASLLLESLPFSPRASIRGRVIATHGPLILARVPTARIGDFCTITSLSPAGAPAGLVAQVTAFDQEIIKLSPFDSYAGLAPGAEVTLHSSTPSISLRDPLLGQVINSFGQPLTDQKASPAYASTTHTLFLNKAPPPPLSRQPIRAQLFTGVRSIDAFCPLGCGQRIGLFAGPGVGKSTLLGMLARNAACDICIVALVGERGREVGEFIEESLGEEGLKRSIVVVSTSEEPPARRALAATTAHALAEYFRSQGKRVLLLVDSLTRVARAIRDVSLSAGELPVRQGYTPSVYLELPRILERAGNDDKGSITAIYTVLTNGEGDIDPLAEEIKSLLDGHLMLDSKVAREGVWPALDILQSVSRVADKVSSAEAAAGRSTVRHAIARLRKEKDMLLFGASPDPELKRFLECEEQIRAFLNQSSYTCVKEERTLELFEDLARKLGLAPKNQNSTL